LLRFAKGKASDNTKQSQRNGVIYTRVSTKEQADTNQSLETQKNYCLQYALKHDLNVLGFFGGTYESAKTDERKRIQPDDSFCEESEGLLLSLKWSLELPGRVLSLDFRNLLPAADLKYLSRFIASWRVSKASK
jgi:hypothetical protein